MRLTIGASVTYGIVDGIGGHMGDAPEVVHTVLVGDILLATEDVDDGRVDLLELVLRRHRHTTDGLSGILHLEEAAVADHQRRDTWVCAVEECLQTAARHTCHADLLRVDLLIERRLRIGVLLLCPVDALYLLLGG